MNSHTIRGIRNLYKYKCIYFITFLHRCTIVRNMKHYMDYILHLVIFIFILIGYYIAHIYSYGLQILLKICIQLSISLVQGRDLLPTYLLNYEKYFCVF